MHAVFACVAPCTGIALGAAVNVAAADAAPSPARCGLGTPRAYRPSGRAGVRASVQALPAGCEQPPPVGVGSMSPSEPLCDLCVLCVLCVLCGGIVLTRTWLDQPCRVSHATHAPSPPPHVVTAPYAGVSSWRVGASVSLHLRHPLSWTIRAAFLAWVQVSRVSRLHHSRQPPCAMSPACQPSSDASPLALHDRNTKKRRLIDEKQTRKKPRQIPLPDLYPH
jgi:hypothetical protein